LPRSLRLGAPASCQGTAPRDEGDVIHPRYPRTNAPSTAEADAWAEVLLRQRLLHAAVLTPTGQWLVQHAPDAPAQVLDGPAAMVDLAAEIQHRLRTMRNRIR
jgi:hypothetical protein